MSVLYIDQSGRSAQILQFPGLQSLTTISPMYAMLETASMIRDTSHSVFQSRWAFGQFLGATIRSVFFVLD